MNKISRIILVCIVCVLISAGVAITVSSMVRPKIFDAATRLQRIMQCVDCATGKATNADACNDCHRSSNKDSVEKAPNTCELTNDTRKQISDRVGRYITNADNQMERIDALKYNNTATELEHIGTNLPRPSAHWFLDKPSRRLHKKYGEVMRNITHFVSNTGSEIAHSEDGISNINGLMFFDNSGWYQIYFQFTILSTSRSKPHNYKVQAIRIPRRRNESFVLIQSEGTVDCAHTQSTERRHHTSCIALKGSAIHKVYAKDTLRIKIDLPSESTINTDMGKSYFGAMYLRQHLS